MNDYAEGRTMPSALDIRLRERPILWLSRRNRSKNIRHSPGGYSEFKNSSRRSLGRNRVAFPRWNGLSLANAASLRARCA